MIIIGAYYKILGILKYDSDGGGVKYGLKILLNQTYLIIRPIYGNL